ncbi:50S ribosomal protein L32 [Mycoplasma zalophi]|uniref:Large ribosomal subunit protein bL32 n=1 Tax=Mycoplasma zalophi TaxID=191287 RepID=A0ABS6DQG9_9MOLU|nr:50S ribosomal protein L32 [Mycoplasma zalophi]MBU4691354.1 50S ribosomal protein L32 [Mycoplasma zalophi]MBU4692580.1 50S ribosomal protein L32 [Mycoplasma zalophi]MCU4117275.1 50S ribosomal protein L32 [Mycoplasma zalophi]
MAIVPKRKTSKQRKHLRRSHHALTKNTFNSCSNCGQVVLPHRICENCGFYNGKKVEGFKAKQDK